MKNISLDDIKNSGKKLKVGMIILLIPIIIFTVLYLLANIYYGFFAMLFISIILILLIARGNKMIKNPEIFLEKNYSRREPKYRKNVKVESNKNIRNIPNMNWKDGKFIIDGEEFYPGYTFEDFKKTHFYNNQDGIRIIKLENMVYIEEHKYIVTIMFWNYNEKNSMLFVDDKHFIKLWPLVVEILNNHSSHAVKVEVQGVSIVLRLELLHLLRAIHSPLDKLVILGLLIARYHARHRDGNDKE